MTYVPYKKEPGGGVSGISRVWQRLDLTQQFLIVAGLVICCSMALLGEWLSGRIAANQLRSRAESGALYMEGFLARHVDGPASDPKVSAARQLELDDLLIGTDLARRVEGFRIWRHDGLVIYSTNKQLIGQKFPSEDIDRAFAGQVVAQLEDSHDDGEEDGPPTRRPLIEIYAPIYEPDTHEVIAVGELYEEAADFIVQRNRVQQQTWAIVGATTLAIMALLFLIVRRASHTIAYQRMILKTQLTQAQALARQNTELRKAADRARMDASKSNEQLLNRIGADLHDGPVQLLSLLILKLSGGASGLPKAALEHLPDIRGAELAPAHLARLVLNELRELSTGLVMPEIEHMPLEAALRNAVEQHEYATGSKVSADYEALPERVAHPLKICLYRVVQEGLNNAFRHGGGQGQHVSASADLSAITVVITDEGPGLSAPSATSSHRPLGLQGIRNRVEAFGGSVEIRARQGSGTELKVIVPMEGNGI
ncbi:ATP-binding protein [Rhizobium sp. BG4]|uniref:sensor histidine kinase n=1 Tax=Rhizobium sp. BG4 TaxID=2613770 RepID=UPI00193D29EF|nr:ATP-binding protein [Rhizobium sp. BG4]QRM44395.1 ATP-binding protein [Rhizobium sp. BG4]